MKETIINFFSNLLSVILGIVITFTIQGMIDRAGARKEVRSALELVRTELIANMDDISVVKDYLRQERNSAAYLLEHRDHLAQCPADSISYHNSILFSDVSITVCHDALELLKMSSLFQKIADNPLSMKIIRAYDACESISANLNRHFLSRDARFDGSVNEQTVRQFAPYGYLDIKDFLRTDYGKFAVSWLTAQADPESYADLSDVQDAVTAIEGYLNKGRRSR